MPPLTFRNTRTDPRWSAEAFHDIWPRGYGYEQELITYSYAALQGDFGPIPQVMRPSPRAKALVASSAHGS